MQKAHKLFEAGSKDTETISRSLKRAQEEIMRTSRITENALRLASLQDGPPSEESADQMKPLDIAALLTAAAEAYRPLLEKRGNQLTA